MITSAMGDVPGHSAPIQAKITSLEATPSMPIQLGRTDLLK